MRGLIVALMFFFMLSMHLLVASAVVEPLGEEVQDNWAGPEYDTAINRTFDTVFKWSALVWAGGGIFFAVRWYTGRERFSGGRPPI